MPQQKLYIQQNEKENFQNLFSRDFNINLEKDKKYKQKLQKKRQYFSQSQRQNFLEFLFLPSNTKFRMLGHVKFHFYDIIYAFSGILYSYIRPVIFAPKISKILPNFWSIYGTLNHIMQNRTFRGIRMIKNRLVTTGF